MTKIYVQGYFRFSDEKTEKKFIDLFSEPVLAPQEVQGLLHKVFCSMWVDGEIFHRHFVKIAGTPEKAGVVKSKEVPSCLTM